MGSQPEIKIDTVQGRNSVFVQLHLVKILVLILIMCVCVGICVQECRPQEMDPSGVGVTDGYELRTVGTELWSSARMCS